MTSPVSQDVTPPETGPHIGDDGPTYPGDEEKTVEWRTGTMVDETTMIYVALASRGIAGPAADGMDLTHVAVFLGVGVDPAADDMRELEELARRRAAGEDVTWGDLPGG